MQGDLDHIERHKMAGRVPRSGKKCAALHLWASYMQVEIASDHP